MRAQVLTLPEIPFVGLRPFESQEALIFFGRTHQTIELLENLHRHRMLAVVGSSGCGKSSLVRAGLIPKLQAGFLVDERDRWATAVLRPGDAPRRNLVQALAGAFDGHTTAPPGILDELAETGIDALIRWLEPVLRSADANLLILVDQFEELFRFGLESGDPRRRAEATDFVAVLLDLVASRRLPVYLCLTMRSDFLSDCDAFPGLPEALNKCQYLVPRLRRDQRRQAIEGPCRLFGIHLAPRLVDRILNDIGDDTDQLPVMQHALLRLWDSARRRGENRLDLADYEAIGTAHGALSQHAEEALAELGPARLPLAERMLKALTATDRDNRRTRRPATFGELVDLSGASPADVRSVVAAFRRDRREFLIEYPGPTEGDSLLDISHESLIRQWPRLHALVDEETRSARIYRRLAEEAEEAAGGQRGAITEPRLTALLEWREKERPTEVWARRYHPGFAAAMDYLDRSVQQRDAELAEVERRRRRELVRARWTAAVIGVLFLVAAGMFLNANALRKRAVEGEKLAWEFQTIAETAKAEAESRLAEIRDWKARNEATELALQEALARRIASGETEQSAVEFLRLAPRLERPDDVAKSLAAGYPELSRANWGVGDLHNTQANEIEKVLVVPRGFLTALIQDHAAAQRLPNAVEDAKPQRELWTINAALTDSLRMYRQRNAQLRARLDAAGGGSNPYQQKSGR
ncbi:MAG TPA: hypothetical protein PLL30_12040 [Candidatus Krumholzibacteria bacterium]|nr:hypothetical protein [Candidatus Krumholzibacteria bacterium]HPD72498.1 hypothetical protein [Candidatus Krumholzibacteria bacterium]HRY40570.1 hypothetical protein [Candidatus Krumholzibacteria bacterium]